MVIVIMYSWQYGDLLHTADTCCGCLKTVGDRLFISAGLWVHQLGVYVLSSVVCSYICPVCVLLFYI